MPEKPAQEHDPDLTSPDPRLQRMCSGDRSAAASLMGEYQDLLRRRFRRRLGRAMRRIVDSQELISTVTRRLDVMVKQGTVGASSERQWWALVFRIGDHALADKARILARLERVEGPDSELAQQWRCRFARAERRQPEGMELELDAMLRLLSDPLDREILTMWLMGRDHISIAQELGETPEFVRKRWERIRKQLAASDI